MRRVPFSKYSGCGNDFILVDNRNTVFPSGDKALIQNLCQRRLGIGADGIILLEHSKNADYRMRIFNADASEAEMCGNGLRCFGRFLSDLGMPQDKFTIEVTGTLYPLELCDDLVKVTFPPPTHAEWGVKIPLDQDHITADFLDTGVPHIVVFTEDLENIDLSDLGPRIRHHPRFAPRGVNVNFASRNNNALAVRTYERGVEEETLACGTGAAAVAIAAARKWGLEGSIVIHPRSGEKLHVHLSEHRITMNGPADFVFRGEFELP